MANLEGPPPVEIPFDSLSAEAQEGVLNDFIYREGTDYGAIEASLERKQQDLVRQIQRRDIVLRGGVRQRRAAARDRNHGGSAWPVIHRVLA